MTAQLALTTFGTFSGGFDIPEGQTPGLYKVAAKVGEKEYGGEFRIKDYMKPTFYLELLNADKTIAPGKPFTLGFKTRRYSGGVPVGTKYEVFIYRQRFEIPQFVVESGRSAGWF